MSTSRVKSANLSAASSSAAFLEEETEERFEGQKNLGLRVLSSSRRFRVFGV